MRPRLRLVTLRFSSWTTPTTCSTCASKRRWSRSSATRRKADRRFCCAPPSIAAWESLPGSACESRPKLRLTPCSTSQPRPGPADFWHPRMFGQQQDSGHRLPFIEKLAPNASSAANRLQKTHTDTFFAPHATTSTTFSILRISCGNPFGKSASRSSSLLYIIFALSHL